VKKSIFLLSVLLVSSIWLNAQTSKNCTLLDRWFNDSLITNSSQARYSGCWGFTFNGKDYATIGSTEGTHFFELTSNQKLREIGFIEGRFNSSQVIHREQKTYRNYAYAICDEGNSSLQIIDLSFLPDSIQQVADIQDQRFGKVHNLYIDTTHALLYACLVTPIVNNQAQSLVPMRVFSLQDPLNPVLLWEGPEDIFEVHDCYVRDNIAFLNCGQEGIRIYDFTIPASPVYLSNLTFYQDQGYNHQGWLSPNGKTYVFADETTGKRVKKCSHDSTNHQLTIDALFGITNYSEAVPHNIICTDNWAFIAYYNEGLRIFDIREKPIEVAFYDTYTQNSFFNMNGAWGVFPFPSGLVIVSDRQNGLFLFNFEEEPLLAQTAGEFQVYPNPIINQQGFIVRSGNDEVANFTVMLSDEFGKIICTSTVNGFSYASLESPNSPGIYFIRITYENYLQEEIQVVQKLVVF
jgi:choice-of-anchor B domain-containing protein